MENFPIKIDHVRFMYLYSMMFVTRNMNVIYSRFIISCLICIFCSVNHSRYKNYSSYRVVVVVAGNREAVTLGGLLPDTQYQLTVTAVWSGKKFRSRPIVFRTLGNNNVSSICYGISSLWTSYFGHFGI